ncbi:hypothetical protein EON65_40435, partial [archaeon]
GKYFSGKITRDRGDGTFDILYDDGDSETRVKEDWVRLMDTDSTFRRPTGRSRSRSRSKSRSRSRSRSPSRGGRDGDSKVNDGSPKDGRSSSRRGRTETKLSFEFLNKIRKVCVKYQSMDETCFSRFEASDETSLTGSVSKRDFKSILRSFYNATKSPRDDVFEDAVDSSALEDMMLCLSDNNDGSINYQSFLAYIFDQNEDDETRSLRDNIGKDIIKRKYSRRDLIKNFNSAKTFSKGYVRPSEMEKVIRKLAPKISSRDAASIAKRFDFNKEGAADYNLLIDWLLMDCSFDVVAGKIARQLEYIDVVEMEKNLEKFAGRSTLRDSDFVGALLETGFVATHAELDEVYCQMEKSIKGKITVDAAIDYIKDLQSSKKGGKFGSRGGKFGSKDSLISEDVQQEVGKSVASFLRDGRNSLGYLVTDIGESDKGFLNSRRFKKLMDKLDFKDSDDLQSILMECLGKDERVSTDHLVVLFMDYYWKSCRVFVDRLADGLAVIKDIVMKKCKKPKDIIRLMQSHEGKVKGVVDHKDFEDGLKKLCGSAITREQILDIKSLLDPNTNGEVDYYYFTSIVQSFVDVQLVEATMCTTFELLKNRRIDFKDKLLDDNKSTLSLSSLVDRMQEIGLPFASCHVCAVASAFMKRGKVDVEQFLKAASKKKKTDTTNKFGKHTDNDSFGKGLWQKICKVRSSNSKRTTLRNALLTNDEEIGGYMTKRDILRCVESSMDLTEEESELLTENLAIEGSNNIDYLHLLLLMSEPYAESVVDCGCKVVSKMLRAGDMIGLRRLCTVLLKKCASFDRKNTGAVGTDLITTILREECFNLEDKVLKQLTKAFFDKDSDGVLYPELVALLRCCFNGYVLKRLEYFDLIRRKQGYNMRDFLSKYAKKTGRKLDAAKFTEVMLNLGIYISDTAISLLFTIYKDRANHSLDIDRLWGAIENQEEAGDAPKSVIKNDVAPLKTGKSMCEIAQKIIEEYDKKLIRAMQAAFDLFDESNSGEVPAVELERIMNSVGYFVSFDELQDLVLQIDKKSIGMLNYNDFVSHAVPFVRSRYDLAAQLSIAKLTRVFKKFDLNGDGILQPYELRHILSIGAKHVMKEELDALIKLLDLDEDGDISWDEFKRVFTYLTDDEYMSSLPYNTRSALRKLQYTGLPDPEEFLTTFVGLPFNYRISVLGDLEKSENYNSLQKQVCGSVPLSPDDQDPAIQFEVQIMRVSGVPTEESYRRDDVVSRGAKFCICQV